MSATRGERRPGPVLVRIVAAAPLGYVAASAVAAAIGHMLPGNRAQAALTAMLLSFAIYAAIVVYVFADRSAWRALSVVAGLTLVGTIFAAAPLPWAAAS